MGMTSRMETPALHPAAFLLPVTSLHASSPDSASLDGNDLDGNDDADMPSKTRDVPMQKGLPEIPGGLALACVGRSPVDVERFEMKRAAVVSAGRARVRSRIAQNVMLQLSM